MSTRKINWPKTIGTVLAHLLFWIIILTYFAWGFGFNISPKKSFINAALFLPGHFIMVYSLIYILVPRFLLQKKFLPFFIGLLITVSLCSIYAIIAQVSINNTRDLKGMTMLVGRNVLPFFHVGGIALSISLLRYWYVQKKQTVEAEQQKAVAELKLLRAQLHPHFLFNTLNNLYSHTLEASPKSPEIVLKLSGLLRFMIYESDTPKIPLTKEIELLQNYITLEQIRYGDRLDLSVTITGPVEHYQIAPLLLLPFLENAFKHGTSKQIDQCWINMSLSLENDKMSFKLINSIDPYSEQQHHKVGGLGLKNVKRRLKLLYPSKYKFSKTIQDEIYVVNLDIDLEPLEEKYAEELVLTLAQRKS